MITTILTASITFICLGILGFTYWRLYQAYIYTKLTLRLATICIKDLLEIRDEVNTNEN